MPTHSTIDRRSALTLLAGSLATAALPPAGGLVFADEPPTAGPLPEDRRLGPLKNLTGSFPFDAPESLEEWKERAAAVRRRVLLAAGLWPKPPETPVDAVVWGEVERDGYTVSRVYFQSSPGLWVTGSLYKPSKIEGKIPGILCPHGHWQQGRFHTHSEEQFAKELKWGSEKNRPSGRHPLQSRCVTLARMGCIVFHYDMLGYTDSAPIEMIAHGTRQRPQMESPDHWGLFSAQAELRLISPLGLQTFNSLKALDWLSGLAEVDPSRIGITGASGGGTQTFILTAIDDRIAAAFPAVMASTSMQGGCPCENACYLRIGTGNIEFTALTAPRPLGLAAANDWTKDLETDGLPELKKLYALLGSVENVRGKHFDFEHNYNALSRAMMYAFFDEHFHLGLPQIIEKEYKPLSREEMTVWGTGHPKPPCGAEAEVRALEAFNTARQKQVDALMPSDPQSLAKYRDVVGGALEVMVGRKPPAAGAIEQKLLEKTKYKNYLRQNLLVRYAKMGEEIPAILYTPTSSKKRSEQITIWVHDAGKSALEDPSGVPVPALAHLLSAGMPVMAADLLYQGDFLQGGPLTKARQVPHSRYSLGYTLGYNDPLFIQRVHDLLSLIAACPGSRVNLVGIGRQVGPIAAAAAAVLGNAAQKDTVDRLAVGTDGFRFAEITDIHDPMMLPGAVRYGDVPFLLALRFPHKLWLAGEGSVLPPLVRCCYEAAGEPGRPEIFAGKPIDQPHAAADWLIG